MAVNLLLPCKESISPSSRANSSSPWAPRVAARQHCLACWRSEQRRVGKVRNQGQRQVQTEDGIRDFHVTGVQTCALPIYGHVAVRRADSQGRERGSYVSWPAWR